MASDQKDCKAQRTIDVLIVNIGKDIPLNRQMPMKDEGRSLPISKTPSQEWHCVTRLQYKQKLPVDGRPNMEATYRYIPIVESRKKEQKHLKTTPDLSWFIMETENYDFQKISPLPREIS